MNPRVAYVDDDLKNLRFYREMLGKNFNVDTFLSSKEFLESQSRVTYDCFIMDVNMPHMDGFELLEILKRDPQTSRTPMLMVTSQATDAVRIKTFNLGATDFIDRLISVEELIARIRSKIQQRLDQEGPGKIGNLILDKRNLEILIGKESPTLTLTEMKILFKLESAHPKPVPKKDLISAVWGTTATHENNLNTQLYNLRHKLSSWDHSIYNSKISGLGIEAK